MLFCPEVEYGVSLSDPDTLQGLCEILSNLREQKEISPELEHADATSSGSNLCQQKPDIHIPLHLLQPRKHFSFLKLFISF